jgi:uncharacterized protein YjbI with pentapeptide repeats
VSKSEGQNPANIFRVLEGFEPNSSHRGRELEGVDLSKIDLNGSDFTQANLQNCNLAGTNLSDAKLHAARLRGANLENSSLKGCGLRLADLEDAMLTSADLEGSDLTGASLFTAQLRGAKLRGANLSKADLRGADLSGADLRGVNLNGADLAGTDLTGALLDGVRASLTRITNIKGIDEATKDRLFAAGAYEGLPPTLSKIGKASTELGRNAQRTATELKSWMGKFLVEGKEAAKEQRVTWVAGIERSYDEWKERQQTLADKRQVEEKEWTERRDQERKGLREQRAVREEERLQVKQERRENRRKKRNIRKRLRERKTVQKDLERSILQLRRQSRSYLKKARKTTKGWKPYDDPKASFLRDLAKSSFEAAEQALLDEQQLRQRLLKNPRDTDLQESLANAEEETRKLADSAIGNEREHFQYVEVQRRLHLGESLEGIAFDSDLSLSLDQISMLTRSEQERSLAADELSQLQMRQEQIERLELGNQGVIKGLQSKRERERKARLEAKDALLPEAQLLRDQAEDHIERKIEGLSAVLSPDLEKQLQFYADQQDELVAIEQALRDQERAEEGIVALAEKIEEFKKHERADQKRLDAMRRQESSLRMEALAALNEFQESQRRRESADAAADAAAEELRRKSKDQKQKKKTDAIHDAEKRVRDAESAQQLEHERFRQAQEKDARLKLRAESLRSEMLSIAEAQIDREQQNLLALEKREQEKKLQIQAEKVLGESREQLNELLVGKEQENREAQAAQQQRLLQAQAALDSLRQAQKRREDADASAIAIAEALKEQRTRRDEMLAFSDKSRTIEDEQERRRLIEEAQKRQERLIEKQGERLGEQIKKDKEQKQRQRSEEMRSEMMRLAEEDMRQSIQRDQARAAELEAREEALKALRQITSDAQERAAEVQKQQLEEVRKQKEARKEEEEKRILQYKKSLERAIDEQDDSLRSQMESEILQIAENLQNEASREQLQKLEAEKLEQEGKRTSLEKERILSEEQKRFQDYKKALEKGIRQQEQMRRTAMEAEVLRIANEARKREVDLAERFHLQSRGREEMELAALQQELHESRQTTSQRARAEDLAEEITQVLRSQMDEERLRILQERIQLEQEEMLSTRQQEREERLTRREEELARLRADIAKDMALERMESAEEMAEEELQKERALALERIEQAAKLQSDNSAQNLWYQGTDRIARLSPPLATRLDAIKEGIEESFASRRAAAVRERERQKREAQGAIEQRRKQEHKERIQRLQIMRKREEERALAIEVLEQERAAALEKSERKSYIRLLDKEKRHEFHRAEYNRWPKDAPPAKEFRGEDLRGEDYSEEALYGSIFRQCLLSGARLERAALIGSDLSQSTMDAARLDGATLDNCIMEKVSMLGSSAYEASFVGAQLRLVRLLDADIRSADFTGSTLEQVDFTGADARDCSFAGADLRNSIFVGARLQGATLRGSKLDGAIFDQCLLKDVDLRGASVEGANFSGSLGLEREQLIQLAERGARVDELKADTLRGSLGVSQLRAAVALFSLGLGSYLFTSYLASQQPNIDALEAEAVELSQSDPLEASQRYEALAEQSIRLEDKVGYLIEASALAEQIREMDRSFTLLERALLEADQDKELHRRVGLRMAQFHIDRKEHQKALDSLADLYGSPTLNSVERARLVLMTEEAAEELGSEPLELMEPLFSLVSQTAQGEADFRMALAELRVDGEDPIGALADLDIAGELELPNDMKIRVTEVRARVQERGGDSIGALDTLQILLEMSEPRDLTWQATQLSIADIHQRESENEEARLHLEPLLEEGTDGRVRGRAMLIQGRLFENEDNKADAANSYRLALEIQETEPETKEEARVSLARLLLESGDARAAMELADLPPSALSQARLGEARNALDGNEPQKSLEVYNEILSQPDIDDSINRAARAGSAESLAALGEFAQAERLWRQLLSEELPRTERQHIEVLLAYGMLQAGNRDGAKAAFASLSEAQDPEIHIQGLLGMAETARSLGEREKARELYRRVLSESDENPFRLQAWQELALIATEQGRTEDALTAWRAISRSAEGDPQLESDARISISNALAEMGRTEEALEICEQSELPAEGRLSCTSLLENTEPQKAQEGYQALALDDLLPGPVRSEAALAAARLSSEPQWTRLGLELVKRDPPTELQLIGLALVLDGELTEGEIQQLKERRIQLGQEKPLLVAQSMMDTANALRSSGSRESAAKIYRDAMELPLEEDFAEVLQLELADLELEQSNLQAAEALYSALSASQNSQRAFDAAIGWAETLRRQGKETDAAAKLEALSAPSEDSQLRLTELLAQTLTQLEDPKAFEIWDSYAESAGSGADVRFNALIGQAESRLAADKADEALELYQEAAQVAEESSQKGWAELGQSESELMLGQEETALGTLGRLQEHVDPEVSTQASIRLAQAHIGAERHEKALSSLQDITAKELGPAWDASMEEVRADALFTLGRQEEAMSVLTSLAERWPEDEEAQLPAWLGLADMHRAIGDDQQALTWANLAKDRAKDPHYKDRAITLIQGLAQ